MNGFELERLALPVFLLWVSVVGLDTILGGRQYVPFIIEGREERRERRHDMETCIPQTITARPDHIDVSRKRLPTLHITFRSRKTIEMVLHPQARAFTYLWFNDG
ncbi:hypothetical protein QR685DRAFT_215170 [Neurospora intermedia]|uniref:Secreted protein n=1 Tax=Neurospora intermedia TaxID=5142 RepID=A0ABR3DGK7_NEUIN